jgi:hypothetical protein
LDILKNLLGDSKNFFYEYFDKITNEVDVRRHQFVKTIDEESENQLNQFKSVRDEFYQNLENLQPHYDKLKLFEKTNREKFSNGFSGFLLIETKNQVENYIFYLKHVFLIECYFR